jgi:hypothetical protein
VPASNGKVATRIRLGDLIRVMWKVPGKTRSQCQQESCGWSCGDMGTARVLRAAREHTRESRHVTRVAFLEVIEYRPPS